MKHVDAIADTAKDLSARERSYLMSRISHPSVTRGVVSGARVEETSRGSFLGRLEIEGRTEPAFLRPRELARLIVSVDRSLLVSGGAVDDAVLARLVGRHVVIEDHPHPDGVVTSVFLDRRPT